MQQKNSTGETKQPYRSLGVMESYGRNRFYILRELFQQGSGLLSPSAGAGEKEKQNDNKLARNTYISVFVLSLRE